MVSIYSEFRSIQIHSLILFSTACNLVQGKFWINYDSNLYFVPFLLFISSYFYLYLHFCHRFFNQKVSTATPIKIQTLSHSAFSPINSTTRDAFPIWCICIHLSSGTVLFRSTKKNHYFLYCMPHLTEYFWLFVVINIISVYFHYHILSICKA